MQNSAVVSFNQTPKTYLHWGKVPVSHALRGLVQEVGHVDPSVFALSDRRAEDSLDVVHLPDDVVERNHFGVRDPLARGKGTQRRQSFQYGIRQLVSRDLHDDFLEFVRHDVSISIRVKVSERLTESFALQALDELGEFRVPQHVGSTTTSFAEVELDPITVKVERDRIGAPGANGTRKDGLEFVKGDGPRGIGVKVLKGDLVVGVGAFEHGLEDGKVLPGDEAAAADVGDVEEDGVLGALDFGKVFGGCDGVDERVDVEESEEGSAKQ
jgi:hypothetical protein